MENSASLHALGEEYLRQAGLVRGIIRRRRREGRADEEQQAALYQIARECRETGEWLTHYYARGCYRAD